MSGIMRKLSAHSLDVTFSLFNCYAVSGATLPQSDTITAGSGGVSVPGGAHGLSFVGGTENILVAVGSGNTTLFGGFGPRATEFLGGSGNSTLLGGGGATSSLGGSRYTNAAAATIGGNGTLTFEDTASPSYLYAPRPA
jgi:hypothetical protein